MRHLDLGHYLDTNHLYKHGLRWWFDTENKDLSLSEMSEIGRTWYHGTPASQLDRKRFDTDLYKMNQAAGIKTLLGHKVTDIQLDRQNGHTVVTDKGTFKGKWLVDASGFAAPLGRKLGLIDSAYERHPVKSYWARVKHMENFDLMGDIDWRSKVNHTSRYLSTNHFMYKGYWIWVIPLDATTTSIGVTVREDITNIKIKNNEELLAFFHQHKVFRELLSESSSLEDFHGLAAMPRRTKQAYSEDRWYMTGMSSGFLEPLFSTTSAFIADSNRLIGDLIATDIREEELELKTKVKTYNVYTKSWWELILQQVRGMYSGSYDVHRMHYQPVAMGYFGITLPRSMAEIWSFEDKETLESIPEENLLARNMALLDKNSTIGKLHERREEFVKFLENHNALYSNNSGEFFDSIVPDSIMRHVETSGRHLDPIEIMQMENLMYDVCINYALRRMIEIKSIQKEEEIIVATVQTIIKRELSLQEGLELLMNYQKQSNESIKELDIELPLSATN